jgi:hypothetical protein
MTEFEFGKYTVVSLDRPDHIKKHGLEFDLNSLVRTADIVSKGREGIHVFEDYFGSELTIVVRGIHEENGRKYGIVRTMWKGNAGTHVECQRTGLPILNHGSIFNQFDTSPTCNVHGAIPYANGFCPWCEGGN